MVGDIFQSCTRRFRRERLFWKDRQNGVPTKGSVQQALGVDFITEKIFRTNEQWLFNFYLFLCNNRHLLMHTKINNVVNVAKHILKRVLKSPS